MAIRMSLSSIISFLSNFYKEATFEILGTVPGLLALGIQSLEQ